jgi:F-type H+-transporting ATPase subunit delta
VAANDIARVYATSLVEIAQKDNILSQIESELKFVADIVIDINDFSKYLSSPGISKDSKKGFIRKIFSNELSELTVNFLETLIENDRQTAIVDIYDAVIEQIDIVNNKQRATIISSVSLDANLLKSIENKLKEQLQKDIIITKKIDEKILGGVIIKIDDLVIDGSLVKDLKNIKKRLLNSKVRSEVAYEN